MTDRKKERKKDRRKKKKERKKVRKTDRQIDRQLIFNAQSTMTVISKEKRREGRREQP